jgi:hypothetical protein
LEEIIDFIKSRAEPSVNDVRIVNGMERDWSPEGEGIGGIGLHG